jgi:hypothetical protein
MNWKYFGRKLTWPVRSTIRHSPDGTEETHEKPQTGELVSPPVFEPFTPEYKSRALPLDQPGRSYILLNISLF